MTSEEKKRAVQNPGPSFKGPTQTTVNVSGENNVYAGRDINIGRDFVGDVHQHVHQQTLPPTIPYLVNRDDVVDSLRDTYRDLQQHPDRTLFCVVKGSSEDAPNELLKRIQEYHLPEFVDDPTQIVKLIQPRTPTELDSPIETESAFRENLGSALSTFARRDSGEWAAKINRDSSREVLSEFMTGQDVIWIIATTFGIDDVDEEFNDKYGEEALYKLIDAYATFWKGWSDEFDMPNLYLFLVLERENDQTGRVEESIKILQQVASARLDLTILDDLTLVRMRHIKEWCRLLDARELPRLPEDPVVAYFKDYFAEQGARSLTMSDFAGRISELVKNTRLEIPQ